MYTEKTIERFKRKTKPDETSSCLIWTAGQCGDGYGSFRVGKNRKAHRVAWEIHNKKHIPAGLCIRHTCDNKLCVNPAHLLLGTNKDNMMDMDERGRRASIKGTKNPYAKLTEEKVDIIRLAHSKGISYRQLSILSGVTKATIYLIINKKTWK